MEMLKAGCRLAREVTVQDFQRQEPWFTFCLIFFLMTSLLEMQLLLLVQRSQCYRERWNLNIQKLSG